MIIAVLVECFLAASLGGGAAGLSGLTLPIAENSSVTLEYWIGVHDEVIFLACAERHTSLAHPLLHTFPKPWILWSHPDHSFYRLAKKNTLKGIRMVIILLSSRADEPTCLQIPKRTFLGTHLADWILLRVDDALWLRKNATALKMAHPACKSLTASTPKREVCLSLGGAVTLFRKRGFPKTDETRQLSAALGGQKIVLGCMPLKKTPDFGALSCHTPLSREIQRALRFYNATVIIKRFKDFDTTIVAAAKGDADVLMIISKQDEQLMELFDVPRPLQYAHETFYTVRNVRIAEVSYFAVVLASPEGFCILLVVMLLVWLAMSLRDYCYLGAFRLNAVLDSGMFLIASFLSNSTTVPMQSTRHGGPGSRLSSMIILTAWMLAIFPLSVYFRGELTSRLTVTVPPDQMDTLEKLELALDRGDVQPCVVRDGCMSAVIAGTIPYRNGSLHAKLQEAFTRGRMGMTNMFNSMQQCLECARKPGFACFSCGLKGCEAEKAMQTFVKSREPFSLAFATIPTTKGYHLARAHDQLLQRLFETTSSLSNYKDKRCAWHVDHASDNENTTQVFQLSAFFATFASLMCLSLFVLCIELATKL